MSLLNAWVTPAEAIIAVDADGVRSDGSRFATSKLLPIPHLNAVLALRGQAAVLQFLFMGACSAGFDTFDELVDAMPALLEDMTRTMPGELLAQAAHVSSGNVLLAIGWSDERRGMLGRRFVQPAAGEPFIAEDFTTVLTPWPPALQKLPTAAAAVDEISSAQVRWMRTTYPGAVVGGKLIACRITREGIAMAHRMTFEAARELVS